jgi:hypothetical protein
MHWSYLKAAAGWLVLSALVLILACSKGIAPKKSPASLSPAEQEEQDPEFWRMWQERRGLGE